MVKANVRKKKIAFSEDGSDFYSKVMGGSEASEFAMSKGQRTTYGREVLSFRPNEGEVSELTYEDFLALLEKGQQAVGAPSEILC